MSSTTEVCFNSNCKETSEKWRRGWRRRTGEYAHLCDRCASAYEDGKFCETFHMNASGWRCCESCGKQIHCGCIVSFHMFVLLDAGGIECLTCAKKSYILIVSEVDLADAGLSPYDPATMVDAAKVNFDTAKKRKRSSATTGAGEMTSETPKRLAGAARSPTSASSPTEPRKRKAKAVVEEPIPSGGGLVMVNVPQPRPEAGLQSRPEAGLSTSFPEGPEWVKRCLREVAEQYKRATQIAQDFERENAALTKEVNEAKAEAARANKRAAAASTEVAATKAEVARVKAGAEALIAEVGAAKAVAEAAKAEVEATKSEIEAARAREVEAAASQEQTLRAFAERIFLCGRFSQLAGELADVLNSSVAAETVEEIAAEFPDLDLSKFRVEVPPRDDVVRNYAKALAAGMRDFPVLEELISSSTLLTAEAVRACPVDRDALVECLIAKVGKGGSHGEERSLSPPREAEATGGEADAATETEVPMSH